MKKPTKSAEQNGMTNAEVEDIFRSKSENILPSESEIASLAAILASGIPFESRSSALLNKAAWQAVALQLECASVRKSLIATSIKAGWATLQHEYPIEEMLKPSRPPKGFPVSVDVFLKLALPKRRLEDRMKIFRDALRDSMGKGEVTDETGQTVEPTDDNVNTMLSLLRETGFDEKTFRNTVVLIRVFEKKFQRSNLVKRAQAGAMAKNNRAAVGKNSQK